MRTDPLTFLVGGSTRKWKRCVGWEEKLRSLTQSICEVPAALLDSSSFVLDIFISISKL